MIKVFKLADIKSLIKQVSTEKITYTRMVEIMNEMANEAHSKSQKSAIPIVRLVFRDSYGNEVTHGDKIIIEDYPSCKSDIGAQADVIWDGEFGKYRYDVTDRFPYHTSDFSGITKFKKITKNGA